MLEKLKIRNFQPHKNLSIRFDPRITTIWGPTDVGKSSIVRALLWLVRNQTPSNLIRQGANEARAKLQFDNGQRIIRARGKVNSYKFNNEKPYVAFGTEVPSDISKALNMSEANFKLQGSQHFWFGLSAGEVSRQLNQIVNLEVIDIALANLVSLIRKTKTSTEISFERLAKIRIEKKELLYIKEMDFDLKAAEQSYAIQQKIALKRSTISDLVKLGSKYRLEQESAAQASVGGRKVLKKGLIYQETAEKVEQLGLLIKTGQTYKNEMDSKPPDFAPLEGQKKEMKSISIRIGGLKDLIIRAFDLKKQLSNNLDLAKQNRNRLKEIIGEGKVCPLCERPM